MDRDALDAFVERVVETFPFVDPAVEGVSDRVHTVSKRLERSLARSVEPFGLNPGEFKLLVRLRMTGPPHRRSAGALAQAQLLSTGAMTNRLDRLEEAGFIRREPDPHDRRGVLVVLTEEGGSVAERALETAARNEADLLGVLSPAEIRRLNDLLRKLVVALDRRLDSGARSDGGALEASS